MRITPKNWAELQHYKDRSPPWIKLHKKLLDNFEWHCLQLASRALAPMLWLLASDEKDGVIDKTAEALAFRLHCTPEEVEAAVKDLIEKGFFVRLDELASKPLATRKQPATPETETEAYKPETEKRQSAANAPQPAIAILEGKWIGVTDEQRHMWATAYPALDLDIELSKAAVWLHANPKNKKSNYERFLANWFTRAQDRAPAKGNGNGIHDERAHTIAELTGANRRERDITPASVD